MSGLQVEVLKVVFEELKVGGGRVEVVVNRDAKSVQVPHAVRRWQVLRQLPQCLRNTHSVIVIGKTLFATAEAPHEGNESKDDKDDRLYDDQLPGVPNVARRIVSLLHHLLVLFQHLPEHV